MALVSVVGIAFTACATLPPAQSAKDLKQIAGKWEGKGICGQFSFSSKMTITEDGTYETIVNPPSPRYGARFVGSVHVSGGKFGWKSDTSGATGTYSLHEGEGKRILVLESANCDGRLIPVKQ